MRAHLMMGLIAAAGLAFAAPAFSADTAQQATMKTCAANWKTMSATDKAKTKYTDYMGSCMKGASAAKPKEVAAPAPAMTAKPVAMTAAKPTAMTAAPAGGGKAKCNDGTVVTYKSRSGTCSGHKGVATWM